MAYRINEGNTLIVTLEYRDKTDSAFTPTAVRYRLDSITMRNNLIGWTAVGSLSTTNTVVVSASINTLPHAKPLDERQLVVEMTDSDGYKAVDTLDYDVENLFGVG